MIKLFAFDERCGWYLDWFKDPIIHNLFMDYGIDIKFDDPSYKCDAIIGNYGTSKSSNDYKKWLNFPYDIRFIMEQHDGTFPRTAEDAIYDNRIKAIFKHDIFRNLKEFSKNYYFYRMAGHFGLIAKDYPELLNEYYITKRSYRKYTNFEINRLDKLMAIGLPLLYQYPYSLRKKLDCVTEKDIINNNRPIDVSFCGRIYYNDNSLLTYAIKHRCGLFNMFKELSNEFNIFLRNENDCDVIRGSKYIDIGLSSKIMLSPYGLGSFCYRDWETIIFGCEGIRPYTDYMKTYPDIYDPKLRVFHQPKNNKDINEIRDMIKHIISVYDKPENVELRMFRFKIIKDAVNNPQPLVEMISKKIKEGFEND